MYEKSVYRVSEANCYHCHRKFSLNRRKPDIYVCNECEMNLRDIKRKAENKSFWGHAFGIPFVWLISIILFPMGLLMYAGWRKSHARFAKAALVGALMKISFLLLIKMISRM